MADAIRSLGINLAVSGTSQFGRSLGVAQKHMESFGVAVENFGTKLEIFDDISSRMAAGVGRISTAMGALGDGGNFRKNAGSLANLFNRIGDASEKLVNNDKIERQIESLVNVTSYIRKINAYVEDTRAGIAEMQRELGVAKARRQEDAFASGIMGKKPQEALVSDLITTDATMKKAIVALKKNLIQSIKDAWGGSTENAESRAAMIDLVESTVGLDGIESVIKTIVRNLPVSQRDMETGLTNAARQYVATARAIEEKRQAELAKIAAGSKVSTADLFAPFNQAFERIVVPDVGPISAKQRAAYDVVSSNLENFYKNLAEATQKAAAEGRGSGALSAEQLGLRSSVGGVGLDKNAASLVNLSKTLAEAVRISAEAGASVNDLLVQIDKTGILSRPALGDEKYAEVATKMHVFTSEMVKQQEVLGRYGAAVDQIKRVNQHIPGSARFIKQELDVLVDGANRGIYTIDDFEKNLVELSRRLLGGMDFGEESFMENVEGDILNTRDAILLLGKQIPEMLRSTYKSGDIAIETPFGERFKRNAAADLQEAMQFAIESLGTMVTDKAWEDIQRFKGAARRKAAERASPPGLTVDELKSSPQFVADSYAQAFDEVLWGEYGKRAMQSFIDAMKAQAGIHSPSIIAEVEIGIPLAEGVLRGFRDGMIGVELKDIITEAFSLMKKTISVNLEGLSYSGARAMAMDAISELRASGDAANSDRLLSRLVNTTSQSTADVASGRVMASLMSAIRDGVYATAKAVADSASAIVRAISSPRAPGMPTGGAGPAYTSTSGATASGRPTGASTASATQQFDITNPFGRFKNISSFDPEDKSELILENYYRSFMQRAARMAGDTVRSVDVALNRAGSTLDSARSAELTGIIQSHLGMMQRSIDEMTDESLGAANGIGDFVIRATSYMETFKEQIEFVDRELEAATRNARADRTAKRVGRQEKGDRTAYLNIGAARSRVDFAASGLEETLTRALEKRRKDFGDPYAFRRLEQEIKQYVQEVRDTASREVDFWEAAGYAPEQLGKAIGGFIGDVQKGKSDFSRRIRDSVPKGEIGSGAKSEIRSINAQIKQRNENLKRLIETYGSGDPEIKALYLDVLKQNSTDRAAMTDAVNRANRSTAAGPAMQRKNLAEVNAAARVETDRLSASIANLSKKYEATAASGWKVEAVSGQVARGLGASANEFAGFVRSQEAAAAQYQATISRLTSSGASKSVIDAEKKRLAERVRNANSNATKLKEAYGAIETARGRMEDSARKLSPVGAQALRDEFSAGIAPLMAQLNSVNFDSAVDEVAQMALNIKKSLNSIKTDFSNTASEATSSAAKLQTQINNLGKWRDAMVRSIEVSDLTKAGKAGALGELDKQHARILSSIQSTTESVLAAQGKSINEFLVDTKDQIARANGQIGSMLEDPNNMNFRRLFASVNASYAEASSKFVDISKITYEEFKKFRDAQRALDSGMFSPDRLLNFNEKFRLFIYGFRYGHPIIMAFGRAILFVGKAISGTFLTMLSISGQALSTLVFNVIPKGIRGFVNLSKAISSIVVSDFVRALSAASKAIETVVRKFNLIPTSIAKFLRKFDVFTGTFARLRSVMSGLDKEQREVAGSAASASSSISRIGDAALDASGDVGALTGSVQNIHKSVVGATTSGRALNTASRVIGGNIATGVGQGFVQAISMSGNNIFAGGLNKATILTGVGLSIGASLVRGVINSIQNAGYQVRNAFRSIFTRGVNEFMTREAVQGSLSFGVLDDQLRNAYKDKGGITNAAKGTKEYAAALKEAKIQGEGLYKWLSELAILSPFSKEEIQPLLMKALGSFEAENAKSIVATGVDIASVSQDAQNAEKYVRALSQIGAAGFLNKEDLNQINDMMAGNQILLDNLIDEKGEQRFKTAGELLAAITKKSITATDAITALQKGADLIFGGSAAEMGTSLKGMTSSISDAVNERLADSMTPVIEETIKPLMAFLFTKLRSESVVGFFKQVGESIALFARNVLEAFARVSAFSGAIRDMIPPSVRNGIGTLIALGTAAAALGIALQMLAVTAPILAMGFSVFSSPIFKLIAGLFALYKIVGGISQVVPEGAEDISFFGKAAGEANRQIQVMKATVFGSVGAFFGFGESALDAMGDVQRGTAGAENRWDRFVKKFKGGIDTYIRKPLAKFRQDMGVWLVGWAKWWGEMVAVAWANIKKIPQILIDIGAKMFSYGKNMVTWLAQGILDGAGAVLDAIFYIGGIIQEWIMPGSPPKFLPDIDKWGRETADVWLEGWTKADFGLVKDIASTIAGYLSSDDGQLTNKESDAIYEAAAQAVSRFKETGVFDASGIQALSGDLSIEMGRLASAYALAAKSAAEMASAQADLDAKTKEYDDLLKGLNKRLDILKGEETSADIARQLTELQRVLDNTFATAEQKKLASNKMAQLRLEQEIAATEKKRDAELATIQERVDLATKENKTATEALELMKERLDLSYEVGKKEAPGGGGDTADAGTDKPDKGKEGPPEDGELELPKVPKMDLGTDELTKRIDEMKAKITTKLDLAKAAIGTKVEEVKKTLGGLRDAFVTGWEGRDIGQPFSLFSEGGPMSTAGGFGNIGDLSSIPSPFSTLGEGGPMSVGEPAFSPGYSGGGGGGVIGMIADLGAAASQYRPQVEQFTGSINGLKTSYMTAYTATPGSIFDKIMGGFTAKEIQEKIATAKTEIKTLSDYVKSEEFKADVELKIGKISLDTASKSLDGFRDKIIGEINSYTIEDKSLDGFRDEMVTTLGEADLSPTAMTTFAEKIVKHAGLAFGLVSMAGLAGAVVARLGPALGTVGWLGVAGKLAGAIAGGIGALGPVGWAVAGGAVAAAIGTAVAGALDIDFTADPKEAGEKIQTTVSGWSEKAAMMVSKFVNWISTSIAEIDWVKMSAIAGYTTATLLAGFGKFIADTIAGIDWGKLLFNVVTAAAGIIGGFIVGAFAGGIQSYEEANKKIEQAGKDLAEKGEAPFVNVLTRLANFLASITTRISLMLDSLPIVGGFMSDETRAANEAAKEAYDKGEMPWSAGVLESPRLDLPGEQRPGDPLGRATTPKSVVAIQDATSVFARGMGAEPGEALRSMIESATAASAEAATAISTNISSGISRVDYAVLFEGMTPAGKESGATTSGEIKTKIDATRIDAPTIYAPLTKEASVKAKEAAGGFFSSFSAYMSNPANLKGAEGAGSGIAHGIVAGMMPIAENVDGKLGGVLSSFVNSILTYFEIKSPSKLTQEEIGAPIGQGILLGTSEALLETKTLLADVNTVFTGISTEATTVLDAFFVASTESWAVYVTDTETQWFALKDRILLVADQLKTAVTGKIQEMIESSKAIVDGIITYFSAEEYIGKWYGTGQNLGVALGQGIADGMVGDTVSSALSRASGVLIDLIRKELKEKAGVDSPSKVMAKEIGRPLGLGVIQGMQQTGAEAETAAGNFVAMMLAASMQAISRSGTITAPRASAYSTETELRVPDRTINQYNLYMSVTPSQAERINDNFRIMEIMS